MEEKALREDLIEVRQGRVVLGLGPGGLDVSDVV